MEPLVSKGSLRGILEQGLLTGKWSVLQFNKTAREVVLPSRRFLEENPRFLAMDFRDTEAFKTHHHRGIV